MRARAARLLLEQLHRLPAETAPAVLRGDLDRVDVTASSRRTSFSRSANHRSPTRSPVSASSIAKSSLPGGTAPSGKSRDQSVSVFCRAAWPAVEPGLRGEIALVGGAAVLDVRGKLVVAQRPQAERQLGAGGRRRRAAPPAPSCGRRCSRAARPSRRRGRPSARACGARRRSRRRRRPRRRPGGASSAS